jgi:diguanylate cyclase (GGDEF)-like protein/PAS domain S-box-containing protein
MTERSILVVEDDMIVALDVAGTLRDLGYRVAAIAPTGEQALERAAAERVDLVLMDIRLAGDLDGIETAAVLRRRHGPPVVFLSGNVDESSIQRAVATHPFGFLTKPYSARELRTTIEVALHKHALESHLRQSAERYRVMVEETSEGVATLDDGGRLAFVNGRLAALLGRPADALAGAHLLEIVAPESRVAVAQAMAAPEPARVIRQEVAFQHQDGSRVWLLMGLGPLVATSGAAAARQLTLFDHSAQRQTEEQLRRSNAELAVLAERDALTGLCNRRALERLLAEEIERARRKRRAFSVAMIDVDRFKQVNDDHGHQVGDEVLREVARRLRAALRATDRLGRFGGEEFLVLLPDADEHEGAIAAERLRAAVTALPVATAALGWPELPITISVGVAALAEPASAHRLLADVDRALYRAKHEGRNRVILASTLAWAEP